MARHAAPFYAAKGIPFFAPGSSAEDLAQDPLRPVFQVFARDAGQIDAILATLSTDRHLVAVGEAGNAGEALLSALKDRLGNRVITLAGLPHSLGSAKMDGCVVAILGSKEFAAETLALIASTSSPHLVVLSDDSLGSPQVEAAAPRLSCPVQVAALRRDVCCKQLVGLQVDELETVATRLLDRPPGPYFLTACLGLTLALRAYQAGNRNPNQVLAYLQRCRIETPYGHLTLTSAGAFNGFTWTMRSVR